MPATLFCQGCGAIVAMPAGFTRNKLRCPECGVMIAVTVPAPAAAPTSKRPSDQRSCPSCGQPLPAGVVDCPECAAAAALSSPSPRRQPVPAKDPSSFPSPKSAAPPRTPKPPGDEDDGLPYEVRPGDEERLCPACARVLKDEDVVCPACDFDLVRGRPSVRVWPTLQRQWDSGISSEARWRIFVVTLALYLVGTAAGAVASDEVFSFVGPSLLFIAMVTFALGTWYRTEVSRNAKGRIRLTRILIVCFFLPRPPRLLRLSEYEGVTSGKVNEGKFYEWLLLLVFVPTLIGMVLWWYYAIRKEIFYVALTRDHGFPDEIIYRGWSEPTMQEVEKVMRELMASAT